MLQCTIYKSKCYILYYGYFELDLVSSLSFDIAFYEYPGWKGWYHQLRVHRMTPPATPFVPIVMYIKGISVNPSKVGFLYKKKQQLTFFAGGFHGLKESHHLIQDLGTPWRWKTSLRFHFIAVSKGGAACDEWIFQDENVPLCTVWCAWRIWVDWELFSSWGSPGLSQEGYPIIKNHMFTGRRHFSKAICVECLYLQY